MVRVKTFVVLMCRCCEQFVHSPGLAGRRKQELTVFKSGPAVCFRSRAAVCALIWGSPPPRSRIGARPISRTRSPTRCWREPLASRRRAALPAEPGRTMRVTPGRPAGRLGWRRAFGRSGKGQAHERSAGSGDATPPDVAAFAVERRRHGGSGEGEARRPALRPARVAGGPARVAGGHICRSAAGCRHLPPARCGGNLPGGHGLARRIEQVERGRTCRRLQTERPIGYTVADVPRCAV